MTKSVLQQQEQLADESLQTRLLTPEQGVFCQIEGGFLSLQTPEKTYDRVHIYRTFPFTHPNQYLSVREWENDNREIGLIEDLSQWDEPTVKAITAQLELRYFTPKIFKIHSIKEEHGFSYWLAETDKGSCRFTCDQNGVTKLGPTRLLITDIDGNRFELPDVTRLSAKELRLVDLYL